MQLSELKKKLNKIVKNKYKPLEEDDYKELTNLMLENIGTTDSKLRDDLIYMVLGNWIMDDIYNKEELKQIINICLDKKHLYFNIGKKGDDSVFTRTFSALILAVLIHKDNEKSYINKKKFNEYVDLIVNYYKKENDLRGYVNEKGWAHSAAHGADILEEIAKSTKVQKSQLEDMLDALKIKIQVSSYLYFNGEDERMASAVSNIINNKLLDEEDLNKWFKNLVDIKSIKNRNEYDRLIHNIKAFLKSLYIIILSNKDINDKYLLFITDSLKEINEKRFNKK